MKRIYYTEGPDFIEVGSVGRMLRADASKPDDIKAKAVEVSDEIGTALLTKKAIAFKEAGSGVKPARTKEKEG